MTGIEAGALEYGALGVLAILLVGLYVTAREWLKHDSLRRDADLAANASREQFQQATLTKWIEQATAATTLAQSTAVATGEMVKQMQEHFAASIREHQALLASQQAVAKALEILIIRLEESGAVSKRRDTDA